MNKVNYAKSFALKEENQFVPYTVEIVPTNLRVRYYHTTFKISEIDYQDFHAPFHFNPLRRSLGEIGKIGSSIVYAISKIAGIRRICIYENTLKIEIRDYLKWSDIESNIIRSIIKFSPK